MTTSLDINDIKILIGELGEYGATLGTLDDVSRAIFDILKLSQSNDEIEVDYNIWIENLLKTERFPGVDKLISDNIISHQVRLSEIIEELSFFMEEIVNKRMNNVNIDIGYAYNLAKVHDDTEGISPLKDIPTIIKIQLSEESKRILSILEKSYIDVLSKYHKDHLKFGMSSENLRALYIDSENKTTLEGQLVSYLDKVDGFMSCVHELFNGNKEFLEPFNNYIKILTEIKNNKLKYPKIRFILDGDIQGFKNTIRHLPGFDSENEADYDKSIIKKNSNRSSNILELFNIDGLIDITNHLDEIVNSGIIDKSFEYNLLVDADGLFSEYSPNPKTTRFIAYESWKIAYAKIDYNGLAGNNIKGHEAIYGKSELRY